MKHHQDRPQLRKRPCWTFCRYCICTSGWYPAIVAPILTIGFLLSGISSAGCDFLKVDVGFVPSNPSWNQSSTLHIGMFLHQDSEQSPVIPDVLVLDTVFPDCARYSDTFQNRIIAKDRTWKVAQVISFIAIGGSFLSLLSSWMVVFSPVPVACWWPTVLLPCTMLSFIAEGSKFLIFDIALCRNPVWFPTGVDSLPETAQQCSLGVSGYLAVVSAVLHLVGLLCVCLRTPEKRELDPNFGIPEEAGFVNRGSTGYDDEDDEDLLHDELTTSVAPEAASVPDEFTEISQDEPYPDIEKPRVVSESRISAMSQMQLHSDSSTSRKMIEALVSDLDTSLAE